MIVSMSIPNLEGLRWHSRVLIIFSASASDKKLNEQQAVTDANNKGFAERDLKVFNVIGNNSDAVRLRETLHTGPGFAVVLIGKDGSVKLKREDPLSAQQIFSTIDAMPMRQQEMKRDK